jgi:hypothetical protein
MNIVPMMNEVPSIANPMISKPALPDFGFASDEGAKFMRVCALDELNGALNRYILSGSEHEMNVIGHKDEFVQQIAPFTAVAKESFEK